MWENFEAYKKLRKIVYVMWQQQNEYLQVDHRDIWWMECQSQQFGLVFWLSLLHDNLHQQYSRRQFLHPAQHNLEYDKPVICESD